MNWVDAEYVLVVLALGLALVGSVVISSARAKGSEGPEAPASVAAQASV